MASAEVAMDTQPIPGPPATLANKCAVCSACSPKYKCPRCLLRTCSLPCVKKHKADQECDGVRDKTSYVSIKNFNDLNLLNDYRFLEDAGRKAESAHRDLTVKRHCTPAKLQLLTQACRKRNIEVKFMPHTFSKRKENTSYYFKATDIIEWYVEWIFPQAGIKHSEKIPENIPLQDVMKKFFDPSLATPALFHSLKNYRKEHEEKGMSFFMKVEYRPANSVRYHKFEAGEDFKKCLSGKKIIEYPSIHVVLGDAAAKEYKLLNCEKSSSEEESSSSEDSSSDSETESSSDSELETLESKCTKTDSKPESKPKAEPPWNKLLDPNFGRK